MTFSLTPYYHYNDAHYVSGPQDTPFILDDNVRSHYVGGRSVLQVHRGKHNARVGLDIWAQHDNVFFGLTANPGGGSCTSRNCTGPTQSRCSSKISTKQRNG